jgi:3-hydroxyacyl-[acyl-carrier-protein] dehydratase
VRWLWIDRIVELVPRQRLVAIKNISLAEEHLHDHFGASDGLMPDPVMPASLIIEGMAQTAGILVGHAEDFREKVALAKISRADLHEDARPGMTLRYTATLRHIDAAGASTEGLVEVLASGKTAREIGRIDLLFSHLDRNMAGVEYPEHNFIFGESFRTVLRISGIAVP